jgi:serine/threonine protein kinase
MGEVYRAKDTKLKREVALKVLPDSFASDPERMARFQREAEVLAALNHPNIAAIYGVEDRALVMELVDGATLQGPIPLETALNYARQIADALEAAHEKGIVHRDLKPANIMITPAGVVKVLDFGLAAVAQSSDPSNPANSPTLTISPTRAGMILGTAAYMSPEQARGKAVDKRADIWAFGVVLFEMLTGKRLFEGETISDTLAAVLKTEPDLTQVPAKVRRLLESCLQKDPKQRLRDIGDWKLLLEDAPLAAPAKRSKPLWTWAAVSTVAALLLGSIAYRQVTEETRVLRLSVLPPEKTNFANSPAVSPDGRRLAFIAVQDNKRELWIRDMDSAALHRLPGTEGANYPFWSPDSRVIAFFAGGKLKKIEASGGPAQALCDAPNARGGTWSASGNIVYAPRQQDAGLSRCPVSGGTEAPVTELDRAAGENTHRMPWFLPDGVHFLYTARNNEAEKNAVYAGQLDSKIRKRILTASSNAVYAPPGYLLFVRDRILLAQPFDAAKLETTGDAVPLADEVTYDPLNLVGRFSASQSGVLVYATGIEAGSAQLTWFDRSGKPLGTFGAPSIFLTPAISPDGSTVAYGRLEPQTGRNDIWLHDLSRDTDSRFTSDSRPSRYPVWSPDGAHIAFSSIRVPGGILWQKAVGGGAPDEVLDKEARGNSPQTMDWSRDGRYIIGVSTDAKTKDDVWVWPLKDGKPGGKPFPYLHTEFNERFPKLSPDGHCLAYSSDETQREEVYVQSFPTPGHIVPISNEGGSRPIWSRDGKKLFYISADQKMMEVPVKTGATCEASVPTDLFDVRLRSGNEWFDVGRDGRFLIPSEVGQSAASPLTVVVNWQAGLKK